MTFLSPAFLFALLPTVLTVYAIAPKYRRAELLPIISTVFFVCANIHDVLSLVYYLLAALSFVMALKLYKKTKRTVWLHGLRILAAFAAVASAYYKLFFGNFAVEHVGLLIMLMAIVSICSDILRGEGRMPDTPWDGLIYITFFPTSVIGPFVSYGDFIEKLDNIQFSAENFTRGAVRLMIGFVKCLAISSVLNQAYEGIISAEGYMGLMIFLLAAFILGLKVYYFLSGYSDMARGIALMLGIDLKKDFSNPFLNSTPASYLRRFLRSFSSFARRYVARPIESAFSGGFGGRIVGSLLVGAFYVMLISSSAASASLIFIPASVAAYFVMYRSSKNRRLNIPKALKIPFGMLTFLAISVVWVIIKLQSVGSLEEIMGEVLTQNIFNAPHSVLSVLTSAKYWCLPIFGAAAVSLASRVLDPETVEGDCTRLQIVFKLVASAIIFAAFIMSVIFLLPQFPELTGFDRGFVFM